MLVKKERFYLWPLQKVFVFYIFPKNVTQCYLFMAGEGRWLVLLMLFYISARFVKK